MKSDYYVYCYFRLTGEPCYIGIGRGNRWKRHLSLSSNRHLRNIVNKSPSELPHVRLHVGLTVDVAKEYEIAFIAAIGRSPHGPLVNLTNGGDGTHGIDSETRALMAAAKAGRTLSPETRAKMSDAHTGKTKSDQHLANISAALRGKTRKPHSAEHRAKIGRGQIGRIASDKTRDKMRDAQLGKRPSAETLAKLSAIRKGKPSPNKGKTCPPEIRLRLRMANIGKKQSPETIAK